MTTTQNPQAPENPPANPRHFVAKLGGEPATIRARNLSIWYGQVIGLNDISVDLGPGVTGLLGPNGAGKSTLMKVLSGQLRPSTGGVTLFGQDPRRDPAVFERVGLVPEQDAFYEDMSGRDFVIYLTRLQGFSKARAEALADQTIDTVGLSADKHRAIQEYSKGMRQRIKIAQALAHDPDILFLDEPLTGTDPVGRRHVIDLITSLGDAGKTVLVSSHVLHEVEQMTREILLINHGRVLAEGNLHRIRALIDEHPHSIYLDVERPRAFAALLVEHDDILSVQFEQSGLRLTTRAPDDAYSRIPALAIEHGFRLRGMMSPDNNLMSVFQYLVK